MTTTPLKFSAIRRIAFLMAAAIALTACGSESQPVASTPTQGPLLTPEPVAITAVTTVTEAPSTTAPVETTTVIPETTTTPTTTVPATVATTTTTTGAPATITPPEQVGAVASPESGLVVVTATNDPLNVRLGPGVQYGIVDQLRHGRSAISTTHSVQLASGPTWALIEIGGSALGWVHTDFLQPAGHSSTCSRDGLRTTDEALVKTTEADVDQDGAPDQVEIYTGQLLDGTAVMWVEIAFANGGTTSGIAAAASSVLHFPSVMEVQVGRLQYLAHDGPLEIALTIGQGASHSNWTALTFQDCELVTTTLNGQTFVYAVGASAILSSASCSFGAHGELTFSTTFRDSNNGTHFFQSYELRGTEWALTESISNESHPDRIEFTYVDTPASCFG